MAQEQHGERRGGLPEHAGLRAQPARADAARLLDDVAALRACLDAEVVLPPLVAELGYFGVGKFNAGQKVFGAFVGGAIPVMLATGAVMYWFRYFAVDLRTGATFVHDWIAIGLFIAVPVHLLKAFSEPTLLRAMVRGWVPRRWAESHRPKWLAEIEPTDSADSTDGPG